jgi:hypothetical protein
MVRLDFDRTLPVIKGLLDHPDEEVWIQALVGLWRSENPQDLEIFRGRIRELMERGDPHSIKTVLEILGKTADPSYAQILLLWAGSQDPELRANALLGLGKIRNAEALPLALEAVDAPYPQVREAAISVLFERQAQAPLELWIRLLGDEIPWVRSIASRTIRQRGEDVVRSLIPALASASRDVRDEIIEILEEMHAPPVELSRFIIQEMEKAYRNLAYIQPFQKIDHGLAIPLLRSHLMEKNDVILENILRVLALIEFGDRMDIIIRAIQTRDRRDIDKAIEVLQVSLHFGIKDILIPILEDMPLEEKLAQGQKRLKIALEGQYPIDKTFERLLQDGDPTAQILVLYAIGEGVVEGFSCDTIIEKVDAEYQPVRDAADWTVHRLESRGAITEGFEANPPFLEKVIHTREISIFQNLGIEQLLSIAAIAKDKRFSKGVVVIREGEQADFIYLIRQGELEEINGMGTASETVLSRFQSGEFFGEIELLSQMPRTASVIALTDCGLFTLEGDAFVSMMRHYPTIPINMCRILSRRLRELHKRIKASEK